MIGGGMETSGQKWSDLVWYHGSDEPYSELTASLPDYSGSLGYGLYLTSTEEHALTYGRFVHAVTNPVPERRVLFIEPMIWECGNSLVLGTPGSSPFSFDVTDLRTGIKHRYSVLEECEDQVTAIVNVLAVRSFRLSDDVRAVLADAGSEVQRAVLAIGDRFEQYVYGKVGDDVIAEDVAAEVEEATETTARQMRQQRLCFVYSRISMSILKGIVPRFLETRSI
jgi:hypothetical protein